MKDVNESVSNYWLDKNLSALETFLLKVTMPKLHVSLCHKNFVERSLREERLFKDDARL